MEPAVNLDAVHDLLLGIVLEGLHGLLVPGEHVEDQRYQALLHILIIDILLEKGVSRLGGQFLLVWCTHV